MKLINQTKEKIITAELRKLQSLKEKSTGLLGKEEPEPVYFQTRWGLHTFGMNFPIDCIICDDEMIVRKTKERLKPNRLFVWNPSYKNVFELPPGKIQDTNTQVLDKLKVIKNKS